MPSGCPPSVRAFAADYISRHNHPVNAFLHLLGVPAVVGGLIVALRGAVLPGAGLVVLGYFFQYLGHRAQGNEVGEIILLKKMWRAWRQRRAQNG